MPIIPVLGRKRKTGHLGRQHSKILFQNKRRKTISGTVVHAYNPRTQDTEAAGSQK